ncbi:MAG: DUF2339 domain-containing protein, partial [Candidatus Thermoplasmatota archaeon]
MAEDGRQGVGVTREEYEALLKRIRKLEARLAADHDVSDLEPVDDAPPKPVPPPTAVVRPPVPTPAAPPVWPPIQPTSPAPSTERPSAPLMPTSAPPPTPSPLPHAAPVPSAPAPAPRTTHKEVSVESLLGQRWAPRVGALLVFLASLFFLGVAIQRGWIGPIAQLLIAALFASGLLAWGAILTNKRGYGAYPQILEGTGASVLYATAFVAYAVPYYATETRLTALGGGFLMAVVAAGTLALALYRDARVIAGLGYALSFVTAGLGTTVLPDLTLAYVALLGGSLAIVVQRKGWLGEALLGTAATGALFIILSADPAGRGAPSAWWALACAIVPLAAFSWLTLQTPTARAPTAVSPDFLLAGIVILTAIWGAVTAVIAAGSDHGAQGLVLLVACVIEMALAILAATRRSGRGTLVAYGVAATVLYLLWPPNLWFGTLDHDLLTTCSYAAGALVLAGLVTARPKLRTTVGLLAPAGVLVLAAALRAVLSDDRLQAPWVHTTSVVGSWQAWLTFALLAPAIALLAAAPFPHIKNAHRGPLLTLGVAFAGVWAFALFQAPLAVTSWLILLGAGALVAALLRDELAGEFPYAGTALLAVAVVKSAVFDPDLSTTDLYSEGLLLAVALLSFFHGIAARRLQVRADARRALVTLLLILYVGGLAALWRDVAGGRFATTMAFAVGGLSIALVTRLRHDPTDAPTSSIGALALGVAAAGYAVAFAGRFTAPWDITQNVMGNLEAWTTLVLVGALLSLLVATTATGGTLRRAALLVLLTFLAVWTFALFSAPFLTTLTLLVIAGVAAIASRYLPEDEERTSLAREALLCALLVAGLAAAKGATFDVHGPQALPWALAALETALTAGALLGLH